MTTPDFTTTLTLTDDPLERTLVELMAVGPSAEGLARLDERIARSLAERARAPRRGRVRRRSIALLAAALLVVGAGAPLGLYDGLGAGFDYGFSVQLARSVAVDASAVDHGFRVTIDRAYLDGERLMLAVRVTDELRRPEVTGLMAMYSVVSDEHGVWAGAGTATSRPSGPWAAANIQWRLAPAPLAKGSHRLHVEIPHIFWQDAALLPLAAVETDDNPWREQPGDWSFDLDLPVDGGATVVHPGVQTTIDGTVFTVDELVIGPTGIQTRSTYDDPSGATWTLVGALLHDGRRYPFVVGRLGEPGVVDLQTDGGVDQASGRWTIVIEAADRQVDGGQERRVDGPWRLEVDVP